MFEVTDEEMALDQKQLEAIPESTKKSTTWSTKIFNRFLFNKNMSVDLKNDPPMVVAGALRKFYANVTNTNGTLYPGESLRSIRAGLHRYIVNPQPFTRTNSL